MKYSSKQDLCFLSGFCKTLGSKTQELQVPCEERKCESHV